MENYKVVGKIGEGGFGEVLRAVDSRNKRTVALKKIFVRRAEDGIPVGVWREAACLRQINHPNVVGMYEFFAHGSSVVLAMECLDCSLADILRSANRPLGESRVKAYMQPLLRGLGHMHSKGLIHRDIKPGNLLLSGGGKVKIGDFGLARTLATPQRGYSFQVTDCHTKNATRVAQSFGAQQSLKLAQPLGIFVHTQMHACPHARFIPNITNMSMYRMQTRASAQRHE
jgi:serine/threonine protein kinase